MTDNTKGFFQYRIYIRNGNHHTSINGLYIETGIYIVSCFVPFVSVYLIDSTQ